jgi:hypothetical protein
MKTIKTILLAIISALLFMGCAEAGELSIDHTTKEVPLIETAGTNHFQAVGFTADEVKIIQKAADMWEPGYLTVDTNVVEGGSTVTLVSELDSLGYAEYWQSRTDIEIENSWPNNPAEWQLRLFKVMMHEFGHHLGFRSSRMRGHLGDGNVMCAYYERMVNVPTEADMKYAGLM